MLKLRVLSIGQSRKSFVKEGVAFYEERINKFCKLEWIELKSSKGSSDPISQGKQEAAILKKELRSNALLVLLDEGGKQFTSREFAQFIDKVQMQHSSIDFVIGGAYGFHQEILALPHRKIALSKMTFPHELVRVIFLEQLYRGLSILKNHPYHHD